MRFYTVVLCMKVEYRFGNDWTSLKTDNGATVGLHPASKDSLANRKVNRHGPARLIH